MLSPSTVELMIGYALSASTAASEKNDRKESFWPVFARKSFLYWSRNCESFVTSTSTTVVSWADVLSDSTARDATTLRRRLIGCVVPRSGDVSSTVDGAAAGAAAACAVGAAAGVDFAAASTSSLRMRPPTPVPVTVARSTPFWAAILRTSG